MLNGDQERRGAPKEGTEPGKLRIAVLPFMNISPNPSDEYFADGITEELISTLSTMQGLSVISRTSIMQYKNFSKRVADIGRDLNADMIIEGSVRKAGNSLRITVQLIDPQEDRHLWVQSYERELESLFKVQIDIAQNVARALKVQLLTDAKERIETGSTKNIDAYNLYLKGRYHMNKANDEELRKAVAYFDLATKEDENFALAYAALADCYTFMAGETIPDKEGYSKAKEYAKRAIKIDEKLAEAHTSLGIIAFQHDWDWWATEHELVHAIHLNSSYSTAHAWYGIYLASRDRFDEAIAELKYAEELDPLSARIRVDFGYVYYSSRRNDEAESKISEGLQLDPNSAAGHTILGLVYLEASKLDLAMEELLKARDLGRAQTSLLDALGYAYATSGRNEEAMKTIETIAEGSKKGYCISFNTALVYLGLGEEERALEFLDRAYEERDFLLIAFSGIPLLDPLRSNPRFISLMRKIGLQEGSTNLSRIGSEETKTLGQMKASSQRDPNLASTEPTFEFVREGTKAAFDYLVSAFIEDYMRKRLYAEQAGWRSFVQIVEACKIPSASMYGRIGKYGPVMVELTSRGLVETRRFTGQRGRGGDVVKLRVAYDKEPVRQHVNLSAMKV